MSKLTHFSADGRPVMVDVSDKPITARTAKAVGSIKTAPETLNAVREGTKKGDVISVAMIAGIAGAKRTSDLIPLCHPLPLTKADVTITVDADLPGLRVTSIAKTDGKTGVEMEALTAVSVACLTLYDMLKAVDQAMVISDISLVEKTGGTRDRSPAGA